MIRRSASRFVVRAEYCPGCQNMKSEVGVACSTYGGEERFVQSLVGTPVIETTWNIKTSLG
jgi:hypothetical protein